jgi:uncharacterized protein (TIGR02145 family)
MRLGTSGGLTNVGLSGRYWSSTKNSGNARYLNVSSSEAVMKTGNRAYGMSVRCISE